MQFEETFDFDSGASTVASLFSDSDCYREKYRRMDAQEPEFLDSQLTDGHFSISMRHVLDTSELPLPTFIAKRLGDHIDLYQTDTWNIDARTGHTEIKLQSAPLEIDIDLRLVERDTGSRLILVFNIRADVAMFGGKIEQAVADAMARRMHRELEQTAKIAADRV